MSSQFSQALSSIVAQFHALSDILDQVVQLVADELAMDACSIFLLDPEDRRLHLMATRGLDRASLGQVSLTVREGLVGQVVAQMRPLAVEQAATHPAYRYFPETREEQFASFLGVPMAIRDRPLGAIIVQTRQRRVFSEGDIHALEAISAQLVGIVANARLIEALDRGEAAERALAPGGALLEEAPGRQEGQALKGHPASPGLAIGTAIMRGAYELDLAHEGLSFQGEQAELARLRDALEKTRNQILRIQRAAAQQADEEHALIFSSHLLLLNDPVLLQRIHRAIADGMAAPVAVNTALHGFARQLQAVSDPFIRDRVEDIYDLCSRILVHLLHEEVRSQLRECVVITTRIPPSLIIEVKTEGARGLVTEVGGTTSHGVLLARAMRVPMVTGITGIDTLIRAGDRLIVDGTTGTVIVNPTSATLAEYEEAIQRGERQRTEYARYRTEPAMSADGVRVQLKANISVAADLAVARDNGAEGVGLYRTEFPFILRESFPTREEQVQIYRKAYEVFPQGPINFRILDLGGDKFVPGGAIVAARDPFHGYRSIRALLDHPHVLIEQVQAFAIAAGPRPLRLLIPMVSAIEELRRIRALITAALGELGTDAARQPLVGVMIEVPAAVEIAADLARASDFLSVGTNDLIQYSLVVNREDSRMAAAGDPYHPAILRMLRRIILAGHGAGKPVSVCGEMASDPSLAVLLVALGVDELSVVPTMIPEIKQALAAASVGALAGQLDGLLALSEADAARAALRALLQQPRQDREPGADRGQGIR